MKRKSKSRKVRKGLEIKMSLRKRLLRQKKAVAKGERGELFDDVLKRLGLA